MSRNIQPVELPLRVSIVGAGIGGLVVAYLLGRAGHRVTVFEAAAELGDVGAGIHLSPNVTRLLIRWGLGDKLKEVSVVTRTVSSRRYRNGERLSWREWGDKLEKEYGAPHYCCHRADLFRILLDHARPVATFRWNSKVNDVDPSVPSVALKSGEVIESDLVIGADGLHSRVRDIVVGAPDSPTPTGDAAYRALVPTSLIKDDPELVELLNEGLNCWLGPERHLVGYCVRKGELYNLALLHPCKSPNEITRPVDCAIMRKDFDDFEPRVRKLLSLVNFTMLWPLVDREPLESWVHKEGKVCLLGDACHPMLPYTAQGASMTVEDAAVLGNLLGRIAKLSQLPYLLRSYQEIRYARATTAQTDSRLSKRICHLKDGPEQEQRDASMRLAMAAALKEAEGEPGEDRQNLSGAKEKNAAAFSYDADVEVENWLRENHEIHGKL